MRYLTPNPLNILEYINNNDIKYTTKIITANYTIQDTDSIIICNNTEPIEITLPLINNNIIERLFIIYKVNTGSVTITTSQNNTIFLDGNNNNLTEIEIQPTDKKYLLFIPKGDNIWYVIDSGSINISGGGSSSTPQNVGQYGYVCGGGAINSGPYYSIINRFQFPFDSGIATYISNLSSNRYAPAANNSSIHGYVCGGYNGSHLFTIDRFQFPFDNGNVVRVGYLDFGKSGISANNSSIHGYVCGGYNGSNNLQNIYRFQFPFDSGTTSYIGNLSTARVGLAANNSTTHGYVCGGTIMNSSSFYSMVDRFLFPFDNGNAIRVGNISSNSYGVAGNNSSMHGYVCGGANNNSISFIDRFLFPFDNGNAIRVGNLSGIRHGTAANNSSVYGYVSGGFILYNYALSFVDRFQFPFDSGNAIRVGNITTNREYVAGNDDTFIPNVIY